jgi:hypothetical protein
MSECKPVTVLADQMPDFQSYQTKCWCAAALNQLVYLTCLHPLLNTCLFLNPVWGPQQSQLLG